jgi:hypothetical protein
MYGLTLRVLQAGVNVVIVHTEADTGLYSHSIRRGEVGGKGTDRAVAIQRNELSIFAKERRIETNV